MKRLLILLGLAVAWGGTCSVTVGDNDPYLRVYTAADVRVFDNGTNTEEHAGTSPGDIRSATGPIANDTGLIELPDAPLEPIAKARSSATANYGTLEAYACAYGETFAPNPYSGRGSGATSAEFVDYWDFTPDDPALVGKYAHVRVTFQIEGSCRESGADGPYAEVMLRYFTDWSQYWRTRDWEGTTMCTFDHVFQFGYPYMADYHVSTATTGNHGEMYGHLWGEGRIKATLIGIRVTDDLGNPIGFQMQTASGHQYSIPEPSALALAAFGLATLAIWTRWRRQRSA